MKTDRRSNVPIREEGVSWTIQSLKISPGHHHDISRDTDRHHLSVTTRLKPLRRGQRSRTRTQWTTGERSTRTFTPDTRHKGYHLHPHTTTRYHEHQSFFNTYIKQNIVFVLENTVFPPCGWRGLHVCVCVCESGPVWQCYIMPDKCPSLLETINKAECLSPSHPLEDDVSTWTITRLIKRTRPSLLHRQGPDTLWGTFI